MVRAGKGLLGSGTYLTVSVSMQPSFSNTLRCAAASGDYHSGSLLATFMLLDERAFMRPPERLGEYLP
jgi:hypothetical protein